MGDRSLDEFLDHGDDEPEGDSQGRPTEGRPTEETADRAEGVAVDPGLLEEADVQPADPTSAWTADGEPCEDCDASVERRWIQDGRMVCADCKSW